MNGNRRSVRFQERKLALTLSLHVRASIERGSKLATYYQRMSQKVGVCVGVSIGEIDKDLRPASEMRAELSQEAIESYAECINEMPPAKLVYDHIAGTHWVRDGAHTISAALLLGMTEVKAVVEQGDYLDAWKLAARENTTHGQRITNADKRARVERALRHSMMTNMSHRQIADLCGVSDTFVGSIARKVPVQNQVLTISTCDAKRVGKDGKLYPAKRQSKVVADDAPLAIGVPREGKAVSEKIEQEMRQHEAWLDGLDRLFPDDPDDPMRQARRELSMEWHRRALVLNEGFQKKWDELNG
jgi:hypothetical protein